MPRARAPLDIPAALRRARARRSSIVAVVATLAAITMLVVGVGGPPTPLAHLYYLAVLAAALLWGPWWGAAVGLSAGVLAEPGARVLLGTADQVNRDWLIRAVVLTLVGVVCGFLTRSLLRRMDDLERLNEETIFAFVRAIDARDPYTARHSETVAGYASALATALGLPAGAVRRIALAGLLHDVGKLALEREVLNSPTGLTEAQWGEVREHPGRSAHIIGGVASFAPFVAGARHHHEWLDGRGYPDGLVGEAIPLDARIIAVADAYDAMTSDRSYRAALGHEEARARLRDGAGTQFDSACAHAFLALEPTPATAVAALAAALSPAPRPRRRRGPAHGRRTPARVGGAAPEPGRSLPAG